MRDGALPRCSLFETASCSGAPKHFTVGSSLEVLQAATRDSQRAKGRLSLLELCRAACFLRDGSAGAEDGQDWETGDASFPWASQLFTLPAGRSKV